MATSQRRSALVESVAQALSFAINDPSGHSSWAFRQQHNASCKRRRSGVETQNSVTVFDSSAIPPIGIDKYLKRLSTHFRCSDASFIAALIIVDRLLEYDGGRLPLTMRNVHRIFLASLVVAVKYHEDLVYSNSHYAKGGGVHLREVNRLERVLLAALDFDLRVAPEQYQTYEAALLALCEQAPQEEDSSQGLPHKPLVSKAADASTISAVETKSEVTAAPARTVAPPLKPAALVTPIPTTKDEALIASTPPPASRPVVAACTALHVKAATSTAWPWVMVDSNDGQGGYPMKAGPNMELHVPWVVLPERAF